MDIDKLIADTLNTHRDALRCVEENREVIKKVAALFVATLSAGGKILFAGNGGSAADAQHYAAEFIGRFKKERKSLPAIALTTDTSILTALSNDYGFEEVFSRQLEGLGVRGDVFVAISTSGESTNLVKAVTCAKNLGLKTVGLLGKDGGRLGGAVDVALIVSAADTPRIQEMHVLIGHILCEITEQAF